MVSSKMSEGGSLYLNDGSGVYSDATEGKMPQITNNYEYEPIDLNDDGYLDTFTINDGGTVGISAVASRKLLPGPWLRKTVLSVGSPGSR